MKDKVQIFLEHQGADFNGGGYCLTSFLIKRKIGPPLNKPNRKHSGTGKANSIQQ